MKRTNQEHVNRVTDILGHHGEACIRLAKRLSDHDGEPLTDADSKLIRTAMVPAMTEHFEVELTRYMISGTFDPDFGQFEF